MKKYTQCNQNEIFSSYYKSKTIVPGLGDGHLTYDAKGEKKHATTFFFF